VGGGGRRWEEVVGGGGEGGGGGGGGKRRETGGGAPKEGKSKTAARNERSERAPYGLNKLKIIHRRYTGCVYTRESSRFRVFSTIGYKQGRS
jgi:hypothetical protein